LEGVLWKGILGRVITGGKYMKRRISNILLCILIVSLLVSMAIPMACAGKPDKPGGGGKPPKDDPPADPVIAVVTPTGRGWNSLVVMNADGSNKVAVLEGYSLDTPSWSPDGSSIAFTEYYDELWQIDVVIDEDGVPIGESKTLLLDGMLEGPEWSPAGPGSPMEDMILFTRFPDGGGWPISLEVIPAGGGDPLPLYTDPAGTVWNPVWSPDGNSIAFVRSVGGVYSLGIFDVATSGTSFTDLPTKPTCLDWARLRDVDEIAYSIKYKERNKWIFELYTVDINSGNIEFLFKGKNPTWSPDDKLCFEGGGLKVHDFGTGESEQISKYGYYPDWCRSTGS
jgi:dipeptidyl aminopeptidase/acylaminoacyl peptidase